jgi:hypothetical protein
MGRLPRHQPILRQRYVVAGERLRPSERQRPNQHRTPPRPILPPMIITNTNQYPVLVAVVQGLCYPVRYVSNVTLKDI